MPYGIKLARKRFKNIFDMEGIDLYIDDIIVWGKNKEDYNKRPLEVLKVAKLNNVTFNKNKCKFGLNEITWDIH